MVVAQKLQALRHNFLHIDNGIGHKRIRAYPIHVVEVAEFMHDCRAVRHFSIGIHENAAIIVRRHFHGIAVASLSFRCHTSRYRQGGQTIPQAQAKHAPRMPARSP